jgi:dihydroneopterin triphosphate diphosphatase
MIIETFGMRWPSKRVGDITTCLRFFQAMPLGLSAEARRWLNRFMSYKQPRSVQVVVFAEGDGGREFLLLRRVASFGSFWQTVTGSLETGETHEQAAIREVMEETGIAAREEDLIDLGLVNTFEIPPPWRSRYEPGVTHNEEVCFALKVGRVEPRIDPAEHDAFAWVSFEDALKMFYWESNRRAFAALGGIFESVKRPADS